MIREGIDLAFRDVGLNQEEVFELRKDLTFLREQRILCDEIKRKGVWYVFSLILLAAGALILIGFRGWIWGQ
jgi:hypothetical protein